MSDVASVRLRALFALIACALAACSKPTSTTAGPVTTCTRAEQQCVYAEGKVGLCTPSAMDCDGGSACLVCMSLH